MQRVIILIFTLLVIAGCSSSQQNAALEQSSDKNVPNTTGTRPGEFVADSIKIVRHSTVFNLFLNRLIEDQYSIDTFQQEEATFMSVDLEKVNYDYDTLRRITVPTVNGDVYFFKRKIPTVEGGNVYPRFSVSEMYFDNEALAKEYESRIDSVINCIDVFDGRHDKLYDYVVQFSDRIIYVACNSMYLSTYSMNYKSFIEDIIELENQKSQLE